MISFKVKIFIAFLGIAMIPFVITGYFSYVLLFNSIQNSIVDRLNAVAQIQESRLQSTVGDYIKDISLITSRTQLRALLKRYGVAPNNVDKEAIRLILNDTLLSLQEIHELRVYTPQGELVVSTSHEDEEGIFYDNEFITAGLDSTLIHGIFKDDNNILRVRVVGPFMLNDEVIGMVEVIMDAQDMIAVSEDHTGLGQTGEVIIAEANQLGDAVFISPLRFDSSAALTRALSHRQTTSPIVQAAKGNQLVLTEKGVIDYRGKEVYAVTRYIDSVGWGLVVKIDKDEAFEPINLLFTSFLPVGLFSLILVVIVSIILMRQITRPLGELTDTAKFIQERDFTKRAHVTSSDEIGVLAETFNTMAARLQKVYKNLEQRVAQRTRELEHAKARDEAMLSSIGEGLCLLDVKGRIIFLNEAGAHMLGRKDSEVICKNFAQLVSPQDKNGKPVPNNELLVNRLFDSPENRVLKRTSYYYTRRDGSHFPVSVTASQVRLKEEIIGIILVFRDITHEMEVDKAKTEFVSLASHQLRTPLSAIGWYSELMLNGDAGKLSEEQRDYLEEIYASNRRMVELVDGLLNMSRLELGTFMVEPVDMDIHDVMKGLMNEVAYKIEEKGLHIHKICDPAVPTIHADPQLVRIIFQNIVTNAIKYTPDGGDITMSCDYIPEEEMIKISIKDTGYGIPAHEQDKIFSKLFRASNVLQYDTDGSGLGLYIVKSILDEVGGKIWFESEEGVGTTFYIDLPVAGMKARKGTRRLSPMNELQKKKN